MGYCVLTTEGAAEILKLNMAIILLPVCRNTITWLRSTQLSNFIPFDDNIIFHKTIAAAIVIGVILHACNHLACNFPRLINEDDLAINTGQQIFLFQAAAAVRRRRWRSGGGDGGPAAAEVRRWRRRWRSGGGGGSVVAAAEVRRRR